jgi:hypothetical protein
METDALHFLVARYTKKNHKHNRREDIAEQLQIIVKKHIYITFRGI